MRASWWVVSPVVFVCATAWADDSNFRPYAIGGRAAGMGGAFTAIADDGAGPFYNPGGIAFALHSSLSVSGSVYGLALGSVTNALGSHGDFNYSTVNIFPICSGSVTKFGDNDTPDGSKVNALAITVYVPDAYLIDDRASLGDHTNTEFKNHLTQTVWLGATYARRFGRLGLGASVHLLLGTDTRSLDLTGALSSSEFANISERVEIKTYGVLASAGARLDLDDGWSLGVAIFSPAVGGGSRKENARALVGDVAGMPAMSNIVDLDGLPASPSTPARLDLGGARRFGRWLITGDLVLLGGLDVIDPATGVNTMGGTFNDTRRIKRDVVVDAAAGMEYVIQDTFPVRAGVFTDFAASPATGTESVSNTEHRDRFGVTGSIGFKTEHSATDIGLTLTYASGQELIPNNFHFSDLVVTSSTQTSLYVFLSSSYEF